MLNLKEKIKYCNIFRRSINQNFEKAKYIMEKFSEYEKYPKLRTLNKDILNILLEQEEIMTK